MTDGADDGRLGAGRDELLEAAPDGMVVVDGRGLIVLVNRQAEVLFGYGREELVGRPVEVLVPEPQRTSHAEHRRRYLADPGRLRLGTDLSLYARRRDGSLFAAEISIGPLAGDGEVVVVATVRDVTDRKKVERQRALVQAELQRKDVRARPEAPLQDAPDAGDVGRVARDVADLLGRIAQRAHAAVDSLLRQVDDLGLTGSAALAEVARDVQSIAAVAERGVALTRTLEAMGVREGREGPPDDERPGRPSTG